MTEGIKRRLRKSSAFALITAALVAIPLITTAGAASGYKHMELTTSVTTIAADGHATVTATVRFILVAPSAGRVTFFDKTTHRSLGSAPLLTKSGAPCASPAHVCRARIRVSGSKLALGANHIVATFNPRSVYTPPFRGRTVLYRGLRPVCRRLGPIAVGPVFTGGPIAYSAASHHSLCRGRISSRSGTRVIVASYSRVVVEHNTVIAFGDQRLPCSTGHTEEQVAYSIGGHQAPGDAAIQVIGRAATAGHKADPKGTLCYESTIPFRTASGARAKRTSTGEYFGTLPTCRDGDGDDIYPTHPNGDDPRRHAAPCTEFSLYTVKHGTAVWTTWFEPTTGDPHVVHLG